MKRMMTSLLYLTLAYMIPSVAVGEADDFWAFYERYPHMQDFYPFGIYGGGTGKWSMFGQDPRAMNEMALDIMAENGLNILWDVAFHRNVRRYEKDGKPAAQLSDYGRWWYGEALPTYGFKAMPSLIGVFTRPAFKEYERQDPPLSDEELRQVITQWRAVLDMAGGMVKNYPDTIFGFVSDDEPDYVAATAAAHKTISAFTGRPVTTCIPSWGQSKTMIPHLQPFTGDWYVTGDHARDNWAIARRLKWMRENTPDRIFWFLPLASAYSAHETTKPWLLDSRPQPVDIRMQFWMAVAGGCKGFYYYNLMYGIRWAYGEDGLLSPAYAANTGSWSEIGRLAPMITSAGPLLLSCRPDTTFTISVACGNVRYPEYEGPAVSFGVLRDVKHDRFILVPYSNDLYDTQEATITVPDGLLNGRRLFDLASLQSVDLEGNKLSLELGPGHGRLLLVANEKEIAACKTAVLRKRAEQAQRKAKIAMRRGKPDTAHDLQAAAKTAVAADDWEGAIAACQDLAAAAEEAFKKNDRRLYAAGPILDEIADILTETDDLLRCFSRPLGLKEGKAMMQGVRGHGTKYAGKEVGDCLAYLNTYLDLRLRYRLGENMLSTLHNAALTLRDDVIANRDAVRRLIDQRLAEVRHPLTLACITGNRKTIEYHANISWLWEKFTLTWFAPDAQGTLLDREGTPFVPGDFDAVWIHQLRYVTPPAEGPPVDPADVLIPGLLDKETLAAVKTYLNNGGGLVLNGISGLYTLSLGLEDSLPDKLQENAWYDQPFTVGMAAAPGFDQHPVFKGLPAGGYLSNGTYPGHNLVPECAWKKHRPEGAVVAVEYDEMFGAIKGYAAVVEYTVGDGRVMVLGGRGAELTPGRTKDMHFSGTRSLNRRLLENALLYVAGDQSFEPEETGVDEQQETVERHILPETDWLFRLDPEAVGMEQKWFAKDLNPEDWKTVRIGVNWESQGYDYNGIAWYRRSVQMYNKPGKRTILHFGAVDEETVAWIDGNEVGRHEEGPDGWDKKFQFDVTEALGDEEKTHVLTVRVHDSSAAGGIWKPVWLTWETE